MGHTRESEIIRRARTGRRAALGQTLRLVLSLVAAGAAAAVGFALLQTLLRWRGPHGRGALLFDFQLSSMLAMAIFAGVATVVYVRLARRAVDRG